MYISHMRSEGDRLLESVDELIEIARRSGAPAEIYHLKQAGRDNWNKLDQVIAKVEAARAEGLRITADMYTYTGRRDRPCRVHAAMGSGRRHRGHARAPASDPAIVARVKREMLQPGKDWENLYFHAGPEACCWRA